MTRGEDLVIEKESCIMYTQEITVNNEVGLHARPATFFIADGADEKEAVSALIELINDNFGEE